MLPARKRGRGGRPARPLLEVATGPDPDGHRVKLTIRNNGNTPEPMHMDDILSPFHSSKPMGTGLGLPIVFLAARRNLGRLSLDPGPAGGRVPPQPARTAGGVGSL